VDAVPLRTRIQTRDGVLVVFDAASPLGEGEECSGYLGYWLSVRDEKKYIFGAVLYDASNLTSALLALERDLGVDLAALGDTDSGVAAALIAPTEALSDEIAWETATLQRAVEIMGFDPDELDLEETGVGQVSIACIHCEISGIGPPGDCGSAEAQAREGLTAAIICCPDPPPCTDPCCGVVCPPPTACRSWACVGGGCQGFTSQNGSSCTSDGNPCTLDQCIGGVCQHTPTSEGGPCAEDGNPCTLHLCLVGTCTQYVLYDGWPCPDNGTPCKYDYCFQGVCVHPSMPDGLSCTPDASSCTDDVCGNGSCMHVPRQGECESDDNPCTNDVCSGGGCTHPAGNNGTACLTDDNPCTDDLCSGGACTHPANNALCSGDGNPCTLDICSSGSCTHPPGNDGAECADDDNPCTDDECELGACEHTPNSAPCDDDDVCTTNDTCIGGTCSGGNELDCNDKNVCTNDDCDPATGCTHTNNQASCEHSNPCMIGQCLNGSCQGSPRSCDDNDACTVNDRCVNGTCVADPVICDDGDTCTPDSCVNGQCVFGHSNCEAAEDPCNPNPVVNNYPNCQPCSVTFTLFESLPINCDDDDGNGVMDSAQTGPVPGENDLVQASLSWSSGCAAIGSGSGSTVWRLAEGQGNRTYRVYKNPDKTEPVDSFAAYNSWPPPSTVWVEGIEASGECPARFVMWIGSNYVQGGYCIYCGYEGNGITVESTVNLILGTMLDDQELAPGGLLCVNHDDDNRNEIPDKDETGPTTGETDLLPLVVSYDAQSTPEGTLTLDCVAGCSLVRLYEQPDRSSTNNPNALGVVSLPTCWSSTQSGCLPISNLPANLYLEGLSPSNQPRDVTLRASYTANSSPCADEVNVTVIHTEMSAVTDGAIPVPMNPAIVAPMNPLGLDDWSLWWGANTFGLTKVQPDINLTSFPITWNFNVTNGFLTPSARVIVSTDKRTARLEIPSPSWGNLGEGRMEFCVGGGDCASVSTLIKNVQPDLEPGDFRFQIKAHLCTDGAGTSTTRTATEIKAIMADVTKVLSQCGIIVSLSEVVTTTVAPTYMRLNSYSASDLHGLFGFGIDDAGIDVFFIQAIDYDANQECGQTPGITSSPRTEWFWQGGIAIGDNVCDGTTDLQEAVRTVAHELVHYLLNHDDDDADADHVENEAKNLMSRGQSTTKRDLTTSQCLEMRANRGGN